MGKIELSGMKFYAYHGYYKKEAKIGNYFIVDLSFEEDISLAGKSDNLEDTLNYELLYQIVKKEMELRSKLLENVCHRIGSAIKKEFPGISGLWVKVSKLSPPVGGEVDKVSVECQY